jgi:hypothetical protein
MSDRYVKKINAIRMVTVMLGVFFLTQVIVKSVYIHSHVLVDGTIVTHAHPYSKSNDNAPFKKHQHNRIEAFYLQIQHILFPFVFISFTIWLQSQIKKYIIPSLQKYIFAYSYSGYGRAPPVKL